MLQLIGLNKIIGFIVKFYSAIEVECIGKISDYLRFQIVVIAQQSFLYLSECNVCKAGGACHINVFIY